MTAVDNGYVYYQTPFVLICSVFVSAFGKENGVPLTNMSKDQVMKTLQTLVKQ